MTLEELDALRIVPRPLGVVWLEDDDPRGYYDIEGRPWGLMRIVTPHINELVRFSMHRPPCNAQAGQSRTRS